MKFLYSIFLLICLIFLESERSLLCGWVAEGKQDAVETDDILYGKDALSRVIIKGSAQVKTTSPKKSDLIESQNEKALIDSDPEEPIFEFDYLNPEEKSELFLPRQTSREESYDIRHAITFVRHVSDLSLLAQRLFDEALPSVKKRSYGFLWRDIGNATIKIWTEGELCLAKQMFRHPSFRRLHPDSQRNLIEMLNKKFTNYFRSFIVQNACTEEAAKQEFTRFYSGLPEKMIILLKRHYPSIDNSIIYDK